MPHADHRDKNSVPRMVAVTTSHHYTHWPPSDHSWREHSILPKQMATPTSAQQTEASLERAAHFALLAHLQTSWLPWRKRAEKLPEGLCAINAPNHHGSEFHSKAGRRHLLTLALS